MLLPWERTRWRQRVVSAHVRTGSFFLWENASNENPCAVFLAKTGYANHPLFGTSAPSPFFALTAPLSHGPIAFRAAGIFLRCLRLSCHHFDMGGKWLAHPPSVPHCCRYTPFASAVSRLPRPINPVLHR